MMNVNLVARVTRVEILRPGGLVGSMVTLYFSRSEWALLVLSGLWEAIRTLGWPVWDTVTAERHSRFSEEDHLLTIASILARGHDFSIPEVRPHEQETRYGKVRRALMDIYRVAQAYRDLQGIQTPLNVFPSPAFPSPAYEAPALEHAVEATHIDTLLDLARHGEEGTFKDLARTLGVDADRVDALWVGTVKRVKKEPA